MSGRKKLEESKEEYKEATSESQNSLQQSTGKMFSRFMNNGIMSGAKIKIGDEAQGFIDKLLNNDSDFKTLDLAKLNFTIREKKRFLMHLRSIVR